MLTAKPMFRLQDNQIKMSYHQDENYGRKHFVMWSGGTDSTLLLYELLDAYGSENVIAISYIYSWLTQTKITSEFDHRELFKKKMKIKGGQYSNFKHIEITVNQKDINGSIYANNMGLPQSVAWMLSVPLYANRGDVIYDGGIKCDDLTLRLSSYEKLLDGLNGLLEKELTFRQPYLYLDKKDVLAKLFHYDIYDCTWHCEIPDDVNKECLTCKPCKTHMMGLYGITTLKEYPEDIVMKAEIELNKIKERMQEKENAKNEYKPVDLESEDKYYDEKKS